MLHTRQRRLARRRTLRHPLVAGATALVIALGLAAGGASPALASSGDDTATTAPLASTAANASNANHPDYWKALYPNAVECYSHDSSGGEHGAVKDNAVVLGEYGSSWPGDRWEVLIVKGGSSGGDGNGNMVYELPTAGVAGTYVAPVNPKNNTPFDVSHWIVCKGETPATEVPKAGNDLDCMTGTTYPGRALTNGDHINMDIVQGGTKFQVNAQIDIRQSNDPRSESGLVVRVKAPSGSATLPLTTAQVASGVFSFDYATYLTGEFTVEWVQFNSTYFNKDRNKAEFLTCGDLPTENLVTPTARSVPLACDTAGSYTLDAVTGVRWFIGDTQVEPGTYEVTEATTIVVRAEAIGPDYGLEPDAASTFTFVFTEPVDCVLPCLPASAVSYTYVTLNAATVGSPTNSGVITVAARDGYSTELCDDFWVVAASWNYSSSTSIWPQTLRTTDPAGEHVDGYISTVGTYSFHAPVECGQGDIYASFTNKPYVGPELFGPSNPFTERFLHNMGFTGPNPTYLNTAPGCNVVNPIAPIANPIVECGTVGSIDISDVANPYVGYTVYRGAAASDGSVAGLEQVNLADATEGVFTVVATPLNGHIFAPSTVRQWQFDLGESIDCPIEIDLRLTYMEECAPDATTTFRVRNTATVSVPYTFTVAGNPSLSGSGIAAPGDSFFDLDAPRTNPAQSYTVTLRWGNGTTIVADSTTKASGRDKVCEVDVQPVVAIECTSDGSYTVPSVLGITWSIAGASVAPGTYTVESAGTVVLRATAASGYVLYLDGQLQPTRDFTLTFTEPETCELPVLPVTNASIAFTAPTCELGQQLVAENFVVEDAELARYAPELSSVSGSNYTVVFVVTADDAVFFDSDAPPAGRVVSDGGKTLTFSGTLLGPVPIEECVLNVELTKASVEVTPATCADPTNWVSLEEVDGVQWWVGGVQTRAGTWPMPAGEHVIEATPLPGVGFPHDAQTRWELSMDALDASECDPELASLDGLAATGASSALGALAVAAMLMLLAGLGVAIGRRQKA